MEDFLTVLNREWTVVLKRMIELVNARMGVLTTVTDDYTVTVDDQYVVVNASAIVTVTLPAAATSDMRITIKRLSASHAVKYQPASGDTLDGGSGSKSLASQYDAADVVSDGGTEWHIVSEVVN